MTNGREEIVGGLRAWSNYTVTVSAVTRAGAGVASPDLTCTTREDGQCRPPSCLRFGILFYSARRFPLLFFPFSCPPPSRSVIGRSFMLLCRIPFHSCNKTVSCCFSILY